MGKPTVTQILINWLKSRMEVGNFRVASHEVENQLTQYGLVYYDKLFNAGTAGRYWREFKRTPELMQRIDIKEIKRVKTESAEHTWEITLI